MYPESHVTSCAIRTELELYPTHMAGQTTTSFFLIDMTLICTFLHVLLLYTTLDTNSLLSSHDVKNIITSVSHPNIYEMPIQYQNLTESESSLHCKHILTRS